MRGLGILAIALLLAGAGALGVAASRGEASAGLLVVFPFVVASGPWGLFGVVLLLAGALAGFLALARRGGAGVPSQPGVLEPGPPPEPGRPARRTGGFVLIGPIPIAFGTTRGLALAMLLLALAALALLLLLPRLLGGP